MRETTIRALVGAAIVAGILSPPLAAQTAGEPYSYEVSLLGGLGGSIDVEPDPGFGDFAYQLNLGMVTEPRTHVVLRLGEIDLGDGEGFGSLRDASLTYANISGEYRFRYSYYDSGIFLGLGLYDFSGTTRGGRSADKTTAGLALGVTGDFQINRRWSALVELSGHWADTDEAQLFAFLHAGVSYKF